MADNTRCFVGLSCVIHTLSIAIATLSAAVTLWKRNMHLCRRYIGIVVNQPSALYPKQP